MNPQFFSVCKVRGYQVSSVGDGVQGNMHRCGRLGRAPSISRPETGGTQNRINSVFGFPEVGVLESTPFP